MGESVEFSVDLKKAIADSREETKQDGNQAEKPAFESFTTAKDKQSEEKSAVIDEVSFQKKEMNNASNLSDVNAESFSDKLAEALSQGISDGNALSKEQLENTISNFVQQFKTTISGNQSKEKIEQEPYQKQPFEPKVASKSKPQQLNHPMQMTFAFNKNAQLPQENMTRDEMKRQNQTFGRPLAQPAQQESQASEQVEEEGAPQRQSIFKKLPVPQKNTETTQIGKRKSDIFMNLLKERQDQEASEKSAVHHLAP